MLVGDRFPAIWEGVSSDKNAVVCIAGNNEGLANAFCAGSVLGVEDNLHHIPILSRVRSGFISHAGCGLFTHALEFPTLAEFCQIGAKEWSGKLMLDFISRGSDELSFVRHGEMPQSTNLNRPNANWSNDRGNDGVEVYFNRP
jgi:hypothetical protein